MKTFEQWVNEMAEQEKPRDFRDWAFWHDRGEVSETSRYPGSFCCYCMVCEELYPISNYIGADEFEPQYEYNVCGGSPRCCP